MGRRGRTVAGAVCAVSLAWGVAAHAAEPWVGRWAVNVSACGFGGSTPGTAALVVNDTSLNWYSGPCRIGKMYKLGQTAYIQARCWDSDVPVTLDPRGDRMRVTWNRGKTEELQRCK
jgi:hypothetical protein